MYDAVNGYIGTNETDAVKIRTVLEYGPVYFSWTEGKTHLDVWMLPEKHLKTAWLAPERSIGGLRHGMVLVGIERKGCFFFNLLSGKDEFYGGYLNEKLGWGDDPEHLGQTITDLATLFTMISHAGPDRSIIV